MTYGQLGIVDGIAFGFAILLDVPTGGIADLVGRRKTVIFSMICSFIGIMLIATASSLPIIFLGWMITQIGFSFYSGAAEALTYDTMVDLKRESEFDKVISNSHAIEMYATAITTFIGGIIFMYSFRLPHFLWGLSYLVGLVAAWFLIEPKVDTAKFSLKNYFNQLVLGTKELFQPSLRRYFLLFFMLLGVYFMYSWGFVRPAMATAYGFYAKEQGIVLPVLTISSAFAVRYVPWLRKKFTDISGLVFLTALMAIGFIASYFPLGYYGFFAMVLITAGGKIAYPWISTIVNKELSSKYRATALSAIALITKVPYVVIAVLAGNAIQNGNLNIFVLGVGLVIAVGIVISLFIYRLTQVKPVMVTVSS